MQVKITKGISLLLIILGLYPCVKLSAHKIVAAIDFGTTYSGYAYCSKKDCERKPPQIKTNKPWQTGMGQGVQYLKTPTIILFDESKMFHSFGFEAENKYLSLVLEDQHKSWYYFRRFKMLLHRTMKSNEKLTKGTIVEDEWGKTMLALDVFSQSIRFLKDHLLSSLEQGSRDRAEVMENTLWVLTVPAIWTDPAKQFMREAAVKAGIPDEDLVLALEPEAASLCTLYLNNESPDGEGTVLPVGTTYAILDMGGGTADIVTHEIQADHRLKEVHAPIGGDWGGTQVDSSFLQLLIKLVGNPIVQKFKSEYFYDFLDMMREFEVVKQSTLVESEDKIVLKVPELMITMFEKDSGKTLMETIPQTEMKNKIEWASGKLILQAELFRSLFNESISQVKVKLEQLFSMRSIKNVSTILMVGGFSESSVLKEAIRESFRDKRIIVPEDPSLAIMKGAVLFGHAPRTVQSRICRFTYGFSVVKNIEEVKANVPTNRTINDGKMVTGVFDKHVEIGQSVEVGKVQTTRTYKNINPGQTVERFLMYSSTDKNPVFVTDEHCSLLGDLSIKLPAGSNVPVDISMIFSETELMVKAEEKRTREKVSAKFDFLS